MIIEREKVPETTMFQSILPGEVFCTEEGSRNRIVTYYIKLSETVYDEYGSNYSGECSNYSEEGFNAVDLADGMPTFFYSYDKCIVKHTAKIIFTEN